MVSANSLSVLVLTYFAAGNFADYTTYIKFKQIKGGCIKNFEKKSLDVCVIEGVGPLCFSTSWCN